LVVEGADRFVGLTLRFRTFEFVVLLEANEEFGEGFARDGFSYRPWQLTVKGSASAHERRQLGRVILTWPDGPEGADDVVVTTGKPIPTS
jgi:hypothetical protein